MLLIGIGVSMDIEKINMYFTDPTRLFPDKLCSLERALKNMVSEANHEIILVSYSISSFSKDFFLEETIREFPRGEIENFWR